MCLSKREREEPRGKLLFNICNTSSNRTLLWQTDTWVTLLFTFTTTLCTSIKTVCLEIFWGWGRQLFNPINNKSSSALVLNICTGERSHFNYTCKASKTRSLYQKHDQNERCLQVLLLSFLKEIQQENKEQWGNYGRRMQKWKEMGSSKKQKWIYVRADSRVSSWPDV